MEVIIQPTHHHLTVIASELIRDALHNKPDLVLGLSTGSTPIGLYKILVKMHTKEGLDFSNVTTFNLDEYIGIPKEHPQSYHTFMAKHFFDHVNIPPENQHIPQNTSKDYEVYCASYEEAIELSGGIDIQVLGIGTDGHIGFNEAGSSLSSRTRIKTLSQSTLKANATHFDGDVNAVPEMAITMGIGTIMDARHCLLLANGTSKSAAISKAVEGPITAMVPASILQMHPKSTVIIDEEAASELKEIEYYRRSYINKMKLKSEEKPIT